MFGKCCRVLLALVVTALLFENVQMQETKSKVAIEPAPAVAAKTVIISTGMQEEFKEYEAVTSEASIAAKAEAKTKDNDEESISKSMSTTCTCNSFHWQQTVRRECGGWTCKAIIPVTYCYGHCPAWSYAYTWPVNPSNGQQRVITWAKCCKPIKNVSTFEFTQCTRNGQTDYTMKLYFDYYHFSGCNCQNCGGHPDIETLP